MARPKKNNVEYFPHTVIHGKKMSYMEKKYKNDGYAVWFKILEELGSTDNHYLDLNDDVQIMFLSDKCLVTEELLIGIINDLVRLKEFDAELWNESKVIYCPKFIDSIQDAYSKRTNECINKSSLIHLLISLGVHKPINPTRKPILKESKGVKNTQSKVEYTILKESKEKLFISFWDLYSKKTGREKTKERFMKLSTKVMEEVIKAVPNYVKSTPEKKFRKDPATYLNGKHWEDELEVNGKTIQSQEDKDKLVTFYWEHEGRSNKRTISKDKANDYFTKQAVGGYKAIVL